MIKLHKLQIISVLLLTLLGGVSAFGQSETINFLWHDKQKNESTGSLVYQWQKDPVLKQWRLHLDVKWFDKGAAEITNPDRKPFIYISDYDLEIKSAFEVKCLNFSVSESIYQLNFQENGELRFELPEEEEKPGTIDIGFKYSHSREDISLGNIDPISIPGLQKLIVTLPDTRKALVINTDKDISQSEDSSVEDQNINYSLNCLPLRKSINSLFNRYDNFNRQLIKNDSKLGILRGKVAAMEISDTASKNNFEKELQSNLENAHLAGTDIDSIIQELRLVREEINNKTIPADSVSRYQREVEELNNVLVALRSEYVTYRTQIRRILDDLGSSYSDAHLAGLKQMLEEKYTNLFGRQVDSVQDIQTSYNQIESGLLEEIAKGPRKAKNNSALDGFIQSHIVLKAGIDSMYNEHWADYYEYRKGIEETGEIIPLETQHVRFGDVYGTTYGKMNAMDLQISSLQAAADKPGFSKTQRNVVFTGSLLLFVLILITIFRRYGRPGKTVSQQGKLLVPASMDGGGIDFFDDHMEQSAEYYKILIPQEHPDIMLSEVHIHIRAIKSVYHLIQGALIDKKPEDFGGLLFGRQYKANHNGNGNGNDHHILIVERVVPALNIRQEMTAGTEAGALLVDEIDKLVTENKKNALLGWFTSSKSRDLEMPENQVKVHRTYFREKWQIACMIYPGSDKLDAGLFVRRKSGFFDTLLSDDYKLNWDDLYQFAVNPPLKKDLQEKKRPDSAAYLKINLNQNWCDSIVEKLFILPSVMQEISFEKDHSIQLSAGQIANGFFYGEVWPVKDENNNITSYEIFIDKFTKAASSENPRNLPGSELLGWLKFDDSEMFESLKTAIPYHNEVFRHPHQLAVLLNSQSGELRFFSRKHTLEMNNNTIETEEFNIDVLMLEAKSVKTVL